MKEIKLAALESSKSLTRLLELLRSYDEAETKAEKVFKPIKELFLNDSDCKKVFDFAMGDWFEYKCSDAICTLVGISKVDFEDSPKGAQVEFYVWDDGSVSLDSELIDSGDLPPMNSFKIVDFIRSLGYDYIEEK